MKRSSSLLVSLAISLAAFLFNTLHTYGQEKFTGTWEGVFMNDFHVILHFSQEDQDPAVGNIILMAASNVIQDDPLAEIQQNMQKFTFRIPAKQTEFEGSFNEEMTELSGDFVFPDGSRHALHVEKKKSETIDILDFSSLKERKFELNDLLSDLHFLLQKLKDNHPRIYAYSGKDDYNALTKELEAEIREPLGLEEFYLIAARMTDAVKCSHTSLRMPVSYQEAMHESGSYFPLHLFFGEGRAWYISGLSGENQPVSPGSEILSINAVPVEEIIARIACLIPSEGQNTTTKYHELNKRFNALFYFLDDSENFQVIFKSGNSLHTVITPSVSYSDIYTDIVTEEKDVQPELRLGEIDGTALLTIPTFAIRDMDFYFCRLDSIFSDLKTGMTRNLVLDLRDNSGGHPIFAAQLLSYLNGMDFIYFKRNEDVSEFEPLYNTMHPNELHFDGKLYVFVDGGCLSTTGHLISHLKYYSGAIFIGNVPGSTFRCNDFSLQLALPNTGIEVNIPRTTFETAVSGSASEEPFPLDYKVIKTIEMAIKGEDACLKVYQQVKKK